MWGGGVGRKRERERKAFLPFLPLLPPLQGRPDTQLLENKMSLK